MANLNMDRRQSGNAVVIILLVLVLVAVGGLAFMSSKNGSLDLGEIGKMASAEETKAEGDAVSADSNPVLVRVGKDEIHRQDVLDFLNTMPAQVRQQVPLDQLFGMAIEQMIGNTIVDSKAKGANLEKDADVKAQLALAKEQIIRAKFLENAVNEKLTDERIAAAYAEYKANFQSVEEVKAAHILVEEEATAKEVLAKLKKGEEFAALAKEYSQDGSSENGGDLGYFAKGEVVPAFAEAAFSQKIGDVSSKPIKSDFGYHIIRVDEKRQRPPAELEQIKPLIEQQLRQVVLQEIITSWKGEVEVERFDINGNPIAGQEPAAGAEEAGEPEKVESPAAE